jgi:hypothetical protein
MQDAYIFCNVNEILWQRKVTKTKRGGPSSPLRLQIAMCKNANACLCKHPNIQLLREELIDVVLVMVSHPHFGLSVRVKPTLPKVGSWSPPGLPKSQSSIARVKSPRIGVFLVSLERSWSLDVQNSLTWAIWTSAAQVMGKRKDRSQTGNLTPDH